MKIKRLLSLAFVLVFSFSAFQVFAFVDDAQACTHPNVDITFDTPVSAETEERVRAHFCEDCEEPAAQTRGLTCDLFGHKLESSTVTEITHKAKATAPRCLQKTYDYEACSRCDYENYSLISSTYIYCCS